MLLHIEPLFIVPGNKLLSIHRIPILLPSCYSPDLICDFSSDEKFSRIMDSQVPNKDYCGRKPKERLSGGRRERVKQDAQDSPVISTRYVHGPILGQLINQGIILHHSNIDLVY
ncbi:hypothetical protein AVEN_119140-1 [Araneus ventricosus]|uniref:Uncharacterized protein n=1 Tax=Araneus ventricosus TaxID=182803 RepID=A0A4Y2VMJ9_ARAVE|nr:hypothetical protein AVEN_119140-1 [Araneus ventricosus]